MSTQEVCEHSFKIYSFKKFTYCNYCHEFIWGLVNQGYYCKKCKYACHKRCRASVPARSTPPPPAPSPLTELAIPPQNPTVILEQQTQPTNSSTTTTTTTTVQPTQANQQQLNEAATSNQQLNVQPPPPPTSPAPNIPNSTTQTTTTTTTTPVNQAPNTSNPRNNNNNTQVVVMNKPSPNPPTQQDAKYEEIKKQLIEMGFSEQRATKALSMAGGKLQLATDILLRNGDIIEGDPSENTPQSQAPRPPGLKVSTVSKLIRTSTRSQVQRSIKLSRSREEGEGNEELEFGEDEWFLDEGDNEAEKMFEILEKKQLDQMLFETIEQLAMQLALTKGEAQLLLRHFNWSSERLQRFYFDQPEGYQTQAGIKQEKAIPTNPPGTFECPVCMNDNPFDETFALGCQHRYCLTCWQSHLSAMLSSLGANVGGAKCMFPNCQIRIPYTAWQRLAAPADFDRFWYFLIKEFVEKNGKYVFCTNQTCGRAIHYKGSGKCNDVVECECGRRFCFSCGQEKHNPASCDQLRQWNEKNSDDQESLKLVKATSKQCFHCGFPTERNQGCNHMTCSRCRGEWCWMCRGDWKTHGSHTGGFYSCNKYDSSEAKKIDDWASTFLQDSDRWMHYYERFFNHGTAKRQLEERSPSIKQACDEYGITVCRSYEAVGEAINLIMESREVLKYTYVFGYFLGDKKLIPFFEYLQANAEGITERLADQVQKSPAQIDLDDLKNRIRITKRFMQNLVAGIQEGLVPH